MAQLKILRRPVFPLRETQVNPSPCLRVHQSSLWPCCTDISSGLVESTFKITGDPVQLWEKITSGPDANFMVPYSH